MGYLEIYTYLSIKTEWKDIRLTDSGMNASVFILTLLPIYWIV